MDAKFLVPFETARQLKEKGYNEECTFYYGDGIIRIERQLYTNKELSDNTPNWLFNECISAPTYHEVVDWLEKRNIIVEADWLFEDVSSRNICFYYRVAFIHPNFPCKDKGYIGIHNIQLTREQALNEGILKALEML